MPNGAQPANSPTLRVRHASTTQPRNAPLVLNALDLESTVLERDSELMFASHSMRLHPQALPCRPAHIFCTRSHEGLTPNTLGDDSVLLISVHVMLSQQVSTPAGARCVLTLLIIIVLTLLLSLLTDRVSRYGARILRR